MQVKKANCWEALSKHMPKLQEETHILNLIQPTKQYL